ncbi:winged helix-turn-helix transcriptional regulator [Streptomyces sp. NBC_00576]|uniref:winged helix-turn-helix transcriptional regulator n=1 Tax=Streptomyces sp. NBC_00576 TaxID=2903665 RepID=UPI002E7FF4F8|nr:helix-turn-helix domain-containing protein [Streptomyces sp. NBC_00576]WUB68760.1 helix-turn-helix transcriptional regulator [Streptomyces sp. NBC_00576]
MSELDHPLPECPIARFLTVLDGPWATLIVRELLTGPKRFTELRAGLPGISPKTLSSRLRRFVLLGLVTRTAYPEIPPRVEYELTPAGARLEVVLATMGAWAEQDLPRTGAFLLEKTGPQTSTDAAAQ